MKPPAMCPVCGEEVSPNAKACRECGADERSGWKEDAHVYDGLDLPDEAWDDDESYNHRAPGLSLGWQIVAGLVFLAMIWWVIQGIF
jgi:hypothetical protein